MCLISLGVPDIFLIFSGKDLTFPTSVIPESLSIIDNPLRKYVLLPTVPVCFLLH